MIEKKIVRTGLNQFQQTCQKLVIDEKEVVNKYSLTSIGQKLVILSF